MTSIEKDFIEFISQKKNYSLSESESIYLDTKNKFQFHSPQFRNLMLDIYSLFKLIYNERNENELIDSYKFFELTLLYRFLSYSYKPEMTKRYSLHSKLLAQKLKDRLIIVDYGCGLGYLSFEIAHLRKDSKVYLIDIDNLILDFTLFRFKKYGIRVEVIKVSKNNLYPKLPAHNLCILWEVMEHLKQPLKAYHNIINSLESSGLLYGNFANHRREFFHVSPDLQLLRDLLKKDFKQIDYFLYKKI